MVEKKHTLKFSKIKHMQNISSFLLIVILFACQNDQKIKHKDLNLSVGKWRAVLNISDSIELPFNFDVNSEGFLTIYNADEKIKVKDIQISGDSIRINFPVFSTYIEGKFDSKSISGYWYNPEKKDYKIPFKAEFGIGTRFLLVDQPTENIEGRWAVTFSPNTPESYDAIGIFKQNGDVVTGTFLTETGDYRYLEGVLNDNKLKLSCFDAAHAFLFTAELSNGHISNAIFYSGKHWQEPWVAVRSDSITLADSEKLTFLNDGYDNFDFKFLDENGDSLGLSDNKFLGKTVIIQIMGTWCPNCMDETIFLSEIYDKYHDKGLEIIAIDYELRNDFEVFKKNVTKLKKDLGVRYNFVFGGPAKKSVASKTLPMLNHILSYPTTIFIDKNRNITKIQTGFNGPGTGNIYKNYTKETSEYIDNLIKNPIK